MESFFLYRREGGARYWIFCNKFPGGVSYILETPVIIWVRGVHGLLTQRLARSYWHYTPGMPLSSESRCDFRTRLHIANAFMRACVRACLLTCKRVTIRIDCVRQPRRISSRSRESHTRSGSRATYATKSIRHEWNHDLHARRKSRRLE